MCFVFCSSIVSPVEIHPSFSNNYHNLSVLSPTVQNNHSLLIVAYCENTTCKLATYTMLIATVAISIFSKILTLPVQEHRTRLHVAAIRLGPPVALISPRCISH